MRKVKFAGMSVVRKTKVVKQFQLSLQLNEPKEIVKVIVVVMAGIRENFYEQLKQYMRSR